MSKRNGNNINPWKKRNDGPAEQLQAPPPPPVVPTELPPLATFILRQRNPLTGEMTERTVEAHRMRIDEARMITFDVLFFVEHEGQRAVAQAMKLVLNSDDWSEIEEINDQFPRAKKGLFH